MQRNGNRFDTLQKFAKYFQLAINSKLLCHWLILFENGLVYRETQRPEANYSSDLEVEPG